MEGSHFCQSGRIPILPIRKGPIFANPEGSYFANPEGHLIFNRNINGRGFKDPKLKYMKER